MLIPQVLSWTGCRWPSSTLPHPGRTSSRCDSTRGRASREHRGCARGRGAETGLLSGVQGAVAEGPFISVCLLVSPPLASRRINLQPVLRSATRDRRMTRHRRWWLQGLEVAERSPGQCDVRFLEVPWRFVRGHGRRLGTLGLLQAAARVLSTHASPLNIHSADNEARERE